jgi:deoxyribodipyrimidine photo-lyase
MPDVTESRIRQANDRPSNGRGKYVLYWSQMYRRLTYNHALDHAIKLATAEKKPLVIYEGLKLNYPWASARIHTFMLEGMKENCSTAKAMGVNYWPFVESPADAGRGLLTKLAKDAVAVVTDDYPAYIVPGQIRALAAKADVPVIAVDGNSVVPLSLLGKIVGAAAHLRPRIHKLFPHCWPHRAVAEPVIANTLKTKVDPSFTLWSPPDDVAAWVRTLPLDQSVPAVPGQVGGVVDASKRLHDFLKRRLARYAEERSKPDDPRDTPASGLSPWLHFGHLSIEQLVHETLHHHGTWSLDTINTTTRNKDDYYCRDANINGFLDEAVTWRDVGFQWHYCKNAECGTRNAELRAKCSNVTWQDDDKPTFNFDAMDFSSPLRGTLEAVLPPWALATLKKHESDRREFVYTLEEFEAGDTHDALWNAAQRELAATGIIHNYLRMLWAKKVLEWSASPEEAYLTLEHLNNKYATDGRDPNSYTGILWCFGLFDRPWAPERDVFGSVRFMSSDNTARKFKLQKYHDYIATLPTIAAVRKGTMTGAKATLFE